MSEQRMLPVKLTSEELTERSNELAAKIQKLVTMRHEAKENAKAAKDAIDQLNDNVIELAAVVSSREEHRSIEVIESFDLSAKLAREVRTDTAEVVSSRPMTPAEVLEHEQARLPFGGKRGRSKDVEPEAAAS